MYYKGKQQRLLEYLLIVWTILSSTSNVVVLSHQSLETTVIIYSLTIHDDGGNIVGNLEVKLGDEAIDVASDFSLKHNYSQKQHNQIVNHLCSLGGDIKCTRRRARNHLFDLYIHDTNLDKPLTIKVNTSALSLSQPL
jgi:hypothetical protein